MLRKLTLMTCLFFSTGSLLFGESGDWTFQGPDGGIISSLVVSPSEEETLYAGTGRGLYESTDGGKPGLWPVHPLPGTCKHWLSIRTIRRRYTPLYGGKASTAAVMVAVAGYWAILA